MVANGQPPGPQAELGNTWRSDRGGQSWETEVVVVVEPELGNRCSSGGGSQIWGEKRISSGCSGQSLTILVVVVVLVATVGK